MKFYFQMCLYNFFYRSHGMVQKEKMQFLWDYILNVFGCYTFISAIHIHQSYQCQQIPREGGPAPSTKGRIESPPPLHKQQNRYKNYSHSINKLPSGHSSPLNMRPPVCSPLLLQPLAFPQRPCPPPGCTPVCLSNLGHPAQQTAR